MVPIFTPENQMLFPFCSPFTSSNKVVTFILLSKVSCRLPMVNMPPARKMRPNNTKTPTIMARLLDDSFICLLYKIIIIKTFYLFIIRSKHFLKRSYFYKFPVQQHGYSVACNLGAGKVVGNNN